VNPGFVCAVEMLPVPKAAGLARKRIAGTCCVWCGQTAALALGTRLSVIDGTLKRWEPRACQSCARREAGRVYDIHITRCARCSHRDYCPDSHALHELALECR